jgi:hypothetical protein
MKGKRRSIFLACLSFSAVVVVVSSETFQRSRSHAEVSVSSSTLFSVASTARNNADSITATATATTTSTSTPFLQWRAGAFGSSSSSSSSSQDKSDTDTDATSSDDDENDDNDNDNDTRESGRKGKKKNGGKGKQKDNSNSNTDATVEEYVAAMRERDAGQDPSEVTDDNNTAGIEEEQDASSPQGGDSSNGSSMATLTKEESDSSPAENQESKNAEPSTVGVKSHKKSNAVGDPDGDDDDNTDDDEDDDDDSPSEYSEEWEEIEESFDQYPNDMFEPQVEVVEVEMVEGKNMGHDEKHTKNNVDSSRITIVGSKGGGGVGVRLGRIANRRKKNRRQKKTSPPVKPSYDHARLQSAWNPFVYFPPSPSALTFLSNNARILDASSKNRLDRRTLYAGLLLEWGATESKLSSSTRKFLPASATQALQAALSLATQPIWRQSAPRTNGIRLYQDSENAKGSTLGMQETIAMALVS